MLKAFNCKIPPVQLKPSILIGAVMSMAGSAYAQSIDASIQEGRDALKSREHVATSSRIPIRLNGFGETEIDPNLVEIQIHGQLAKVLFDRGVSLVAMRKDHTKGGLSYRGDGLIFIKGMYNEIQTEQFSVPPFAFKLDRHGNAARLSVDPSTLRNQITRAITDRLRIPPYTDDQIREEALERADTSVESILKDPHATESVKDAARSLLADLRGAHDPLTFERTLQDVDVAIENATERQTARSLLMPPPKVTPVTPEASAGFPFGTVVPIAGVAALGLFGASRLRRMKKP